MSHIRRILSSVLTTLGLVLLSLFAMSVSNMAVARHARLDGPDGPGHLLCVCDYSHCHEGMRNDGTPVCYFDLLSQWGTCVPRYAEDPCDSNCACSIALGIDEFFCFCG